MRETDVLHIGSQLDGELTPVEAAPPRGRVHLVDRHRPIERILRPPRLEPVAVQPLVLGAKDHRRRLRRQLLLERDRVGFLASVEMELVAVPGRRSLDDSRPDARRIDRRQRVGCRVPVVEVADDADVLRVRRPHREADTRLDEMRTELPPQLLMPACPCKPDIELAESGGQTGTSSSSMRASPSTGMRNALAKSLLRPELRRMQERTSVLLKRLEALYQDGIAELEQLDNAWDKEQAKVIGQLAGLYRRFAYLERWIERLKERQFQLSI